MASKKTYVTLKSDDLTLEKMRELFTISDKILPGTHMGQSFVHHNIVAKDPDISYNIAFSSPMVSSPLTRMEGVGSVSFMINSDVYGKKNPTTEEYVKTEEGDRLVTLLDNFMLFYAELISLKQNEEMRRTILLKGGASPSMIPSKMAKPLIITHEDENTGVKTDIVDPEVLISPVKISYDEYGVEQKTKSPSVGLKVWLGKIKQDVPMKMGNFIIPETNQIVYTNIYVPDDHGRFKKATNMNDISSYVYFKGDASLRGKSYFKTLLELESMLPNLYWSKGVCALQIKLTKVYVLTKIEIPQKEMGEGNIADLQQKKMSILKEYGLKEDTSDVVGSHGPSHSMQNEGDAYYDELHQIEDEINDDMNHSSGYIDNNSHRTPYDRPGSSNNFALKHNVRGSGAKTPNMTDSPKSEDELSQFSF